MTYIKPYDINDSIVKKIIKYSKTYGLWGVFWKVNRKILHFIKKPYFILYSKLKREKTFIFKNDKVKCFYHHYNNTFQNERCIEIPIVMRFIEKYSRASNSKILEVGNVLSHYIKSNWIIIDKFEESHNVKVINEDFCSYKFKMRFDLIISISTIEHIGFDDTIKDPHKAIKALYKIKELLKPNGEAVITIPIGYNKDLDNFIKNEKIFDEVYYYYREGVDLWKNSTFFSEVKYNAPYKAANGLVIGIFYGVQKTSNKN